MITNYNYKFMAKFRLRIKVYSFAYLDVEAKNEAEASKQINESNELTVYDGGYRELMGVEKKINC